MISIIDYNAGNPGSILNMLRKLGYYETTVTSDPRIISKSTKLILPGVGSFLHGMEQIKKSNLIELLHEKVIIDKTPILGICLGMQLMANHSEEGDIEGLGWLDGEVVKFNTNEIKLPVPHMGWNRLIINQDCEILNDIDTQKNKFYFAHSFYFRSFNQDHNVAETDYGINFTSVIQKENIFGVQFHPEKSHRWGLQLLKNYLNIENK